MPRPPKKNKDDWLYIRLTKEQKDLLNDFALALGLPVSTWLLSLGLKEAQKEEKHA